MTWFSAILFLTALTFCVVSEAEHQHKDHPSAVVVGTVYCDTCFQQDFSKNNHFIPGASVLVKCKDGNFKKQVKTNEHGEFKVDLPFTVSKHVRKIERCSVKLISSSEPYCAVASSATSSSLHLKARKEGVHVFSAGFFTFKPLKQPIFCNQKPTDFGNKKTDIGTSKDIPFPPPIQDPPVPGLPPLPLLPNLPPLPLLPPLPELPNPPPLLPRAKSQTVDQKVAQPERFPRRPATIFPPFSFLPPPIPVLQPPPILPPNPLLPPPAPLIPLPPNPLQPPPSLLIPIPPIPVLAPSPPPPTFPIPLPPFPFPRPSFPGIPPASTTP